MIFLCCVGRLRPADGRSAPRCPLGRLGGVLCPIWHDAPPAPAATDRSGSKSTGRDLPCTLVRDGATFGPADSLDTFAAISKSPCPESSCRCADQWGAEVDASVPASLVARK